MSNWFYVVPLFGVVGLLFVFVRSAWVTKQDAGNDRMKEISKHVAEGAMAFLRAEWRILGIYAVIAAFLLVLLGMSNPDSSPLIALAFIVGAVFSATAGYIGMRIATRANVRTANAARTSLAKALSVSFTGGSVMGLGVTGLAVLVRIDRFRKTLLCAFCALCGQIPDPQTGHDEACPSR